MLPPVTPPPEPVTLVPMPVPPCCLLAWWILCSSVPGRCCAASRNGCESRTSISDPETWPYHMCTCFFEWEHVSTQGSTLLCKTACFQERAGEPVTHLLDLGADALVGRVHGCLDTLLVVLVVLVLGACKGEGTVESAQ
jgi:hypothetical protein